MECPPEPAADSSWRMELEETESRWLPYDECREAFDVRGAHTRPYNTSIRWRYSLERGHSEERNPTRAPNVVIEELS